MLSAFIDLLVMPFRWFWAEPDQGTHPDDIGADMERKYEETFGEPWSALESRVLARHPEYRNFLTINEKEPQS